MSFLTQNDFIDVVAQHIRSHGVAYWNDIFNVIRLNFELSSEDLEPVCAYEHRYHSNAMNLKSNKSLIRKFSDIVQVRGGFATRQFAEEHNIYITDDGLGLSSRGPRARSKSQVSRETILKVLSSYYMSIKNTLTPVAITQLRNARESMINAILIQKPGTDEDEIKGLVLEQFMKYYR